MVVVVLAFIGTTVEVALGVGVLLGPRVGVLVAVKVGVDVLLGPRVGADGGLPAVHLSPVL